MADPSVKVLPVFRPRVEGNTTAKKSPVVSATTKVPPRTRKDPSEQHPMLSDNVMTSMDTEDEAPSVPVRPQKRQVLIFDEAELYEPPKPTSTNAPEKLKKTTVLRIKRKRDEQTLDAIVLEAPASKKREIEELESAIKVMNIRKDSEGNQVSEVSSVEKTVEYKFKAEATKEDTFKDREFKRRVFRYLGTVSGAGKFTADEVQKKLVQLKSDREPAKQTAKSGTDKAKEERMNSWKAQSKESRFQELTKLRRAASDNTQDKALNVLELQNPQDSASSRPQTPSKGAPNMTGQASGVQLPVVKSSKQMAQEDFVVDYFVYDADVEVSDLNPESTAVVGVEHFDESLLDDDYLAENEYSDKEFDSDDSQNRDWDYPSDSESDADSSDEDEKMYARGGRRRRQNNPYDPFAPFGGIKKALEAGSDSDESGDDDSYDEDGEDDNRLVFRNRLGRADDEMGLSSDDEDDFDHYDEKYVQYQEHQDHMDEDD